MAVFYSFSQEGEPSRDGYQQIHFGGEGGWVGEGHFLRVFDELNREGHRLSVLNLESGSPEHSFSQLFSPSEAVNTRVKHPRQIEAGDLWLLLEVSV